MIKFNRYSSKFEFKFSAYLGQLFPKKSAYGPIRLLRRKSDGKLFKVNPGSLTESPFEKRFLVAYRKGVLPKDGWNLVFFNELEDAMGLDSMIPDTLEIPEALRLRDNNNVALLDPISLLLIYEPQP